MHEHLQRADETNEQRKAGRKYDKSIAIYLRGHGATKNVKDVPGEKRGGLALLENRAVAPKTSGAGQLVKREAMNMSDIRMFALNYFAWAMQAKSSGPAARRQAHDER